MNRASASSMRIRGKDGKKIGYGKSKRFSEETGKMTIIVST
jgi:hypothetical protein